MVKVLCDYCGNGAQKGVIEMARSVILNPKLEHISVVLRVSIHTDDDSSPDLALCNPCAKEAIDRTFGEP